MPRWNPPLLPGQQIAIAIIPKFTSTLSIVGSAYIAHHVLSERKRRSKVYHRLLLGMSLMDLISSFKSFLSTWPSPADTFGVWGARGTTQTCTASAFFGHGSSLASPLYNGSLTLYYYLTINRGWRFKDGKLGRLEPYLHAVPLLIGWGTAAASLPLKLFNSIGWTCWIAPLPYGCKQSYEYGYTTCVRGDNAYVYRWAFFHAELWMTFFLTAIGMGLIYREVSRRERANERYDEHDSIRGKRRDRSRRVAMQALLYVLAYYLTWIFPTITWLTQLMADKSYTVILFCQAIFVPLQGAFNAGIYVRPRYLRYRDNNPDVGAVMSLWRALRSEPTASGMARGRSRKSSSGRRSSLGLPRAWQRQERRERKSVDDPDVHSFYNRMTQVSSLNFLMSFLGSSGRRSSGDTNPKVLTKRQEAKDAIESSSDDEGNGMEERVKGAPKLEDFRDDECVSQIVGDEEGCLPGNQPPLAAAGEMTPIDRDDEVSEEWKAVSEVYEDQLE